MHLSFTDEGKGYVSKLDKVSAGAHAAVTGDEGIYAVIEETGQQSHYIRMNARACLEESAYTGNHGRPYGCVSKGLSCTGRVTPYNIILEVFQVLIVHAPLRHGAKTRIDAVNDLVLVEFFEETVTALHFLHCLFWQYNILPAKNYPAHIIRRKILHVLFKMSCKFTNFDKI